MHTVAKQLLILTLSLIASHAHAQNDAQTLQAQAHAEVVGVCKILNAKDINFGTLNPQEAIDTFAEGGLSFACTKGMSYHLTIDQGQNHDPISNTRRLKLDAGQDFLVYTLNTTGLSGEGNGFNQALDIQMRATILGAHYKDLPAGAYQDTLRIVIEP